MRRGALSLSVRTCDVTGARPSYSVLAALLVRHRFTSLTGVTAGAQVGGANPWAGRGGTSPARDGSSSPGTTVMAHMLENNGAAGVRFTSAELTELNSAVRAIEIRGQRLPDAVLVFSGVEAQPKK